MTITTPRSVFADFADASYPHAFRGEIRVGCLVGGIPTNANVAEGWIKSKLADKDDLLRELVAQTMIEREVGAAEAAAIVDDLRHLNGFKRDPDGQLFIEGRQLKAALKEAASIAAAADKIKVRGWAKTNKGVKSLLAEHVFVMEERLLLTDESGEAITEPSGVAQRFVHTHRGNAIQYEEFVENAHFTFTVRTDQDLTDKDWAMIWTTGEQQGVGATRSQGFGRYEVVRWDAM
jgi:hypothetical protein